jgi:hypothetical protein
MERTKEQWAKMVPAAVLAGSEAQARFCLQDAQKDIAALYSLNSELKSVVVAALNLVQAFRTMDGIQTSIMIEERLKKLCSTLGVEYPAAMPPAAAKAQP